MAFDNQTNSQDQNSGIKNSWQNNHASVSAPDRDATGNIAEKVGSYAKIIFWIAAVATIILIGFGIYYFYQYNKSKDLVFTVNYPARVMIGKPFELKIDVENKSKNPLRQAKIVVDLSPGVVALSQNPDKHYIEDNIGDLSRGAILEKTYKVAILQDESSIKQFNAKIFYLPQNLNARFEVGKTFEITADQPAVSMSLSAPQKVFNNEAFEINVNFQNLSDIEYRNFKIQLDYPDSFVFKEASSSPSAGNNVWIFDKIAPNSQNNVIVKGRLTGPDQSFYDLKAKIFADLNGQEYQLNEKTATLNISSSPLSLNIIANNNPNYVASVGDIMSYEIGYKNNTEVGLSDVVITARLSGEMYDYGSIQAQGGYFDPRTKTITWNAAGNSALKLLSQGQAGKISFIIRIKPDFPIKRMFDKNFTLKVRGEINSPTVPYNVSSDKTAGVAGLETKVSGKIILETFAEYIKGSNPPALNKTTTYNIRWTVRNYSTDAKDVKVSAVLSPGVKWLNIVKSGTDSIPLHNDRTGEITWDIPRVLAAKGVIGKPIEASFQVEVSPNQAGPVQVINQVQISATDDFTGSQLSGKSDPIMVGR